jgi:hypothetical protein
MFSHAEVPPLAELSVIVPAGVMKSNHLFRVVPSFALAVVRLSQNA